MHCGILTSTLTFNIFHTFWLVVKGCWTFWKDSDKHNSFRNSSVPKWSVLGGLSPSAGSAWDRVDMPSKGVYGSPGRMAAVLWWCPQLWQGTGGQCVVSGAAQPQGCGAQVVPLCPKGGHLGHTSSTGMGHLQMQES